MGSNSAEGMDVCVLRFLCIVQVVGSVMVWSVVQRVCVSNCVWCRSLENEVDWVVFGFLCHRKLYKLYLITLCGFAQ